MSNKIYNVLKWVALIGLPALGTLIFGLSAIWGFDGSKIIGSIAVIETFLGSLIGVSTYQYNKGLNKPNRNEEDDNK